MSLQIQLRWRWKCLTRLCCPIPNIEDMPRYDLFTTPTWITITKVYDGDTFWFAYKLNGKWLQMKIRLAGVDTPEIRPKKENRTQEDLDMEKERARQAREFVEDWFRKEKMVVRFQTSGGSDDKKGNNVDKYGRWLGRIYNHHNEDLTELLIKYGHGYPYEGGTKRTGTIQSPISSQTQAETIYPSE